jgi:hypothetical protein
MGLSCLGNPYFCRIQGNAERYDIVGLYTLYPLFANVGTNFVDKRPSPGRYISFAYSGHGV